MGEERFDGMQQVGSGWPADGAQQAAGAWPIDDGQPIAAPANSQNLSADAVPSIADWVTPETQEAVRAIADAAKVSEPYRRLASLLPWPAPDANKYSRGTLTIVAGSRKYGGSPILCGLAAQRMGAGYTHILTQSNNVNVVRTAAPELVCEAYGLSGGTCSEFPVSTPERPCAVLVGSGFDREEMDGLSLVTTALRAASPVVIDGGGIAALAAHRTRAVLAARDAKRYPVVITPHMGEAMALATALELQGPAEEARQKMDAPHLAAALAFTLHAIIVLKGPVTYIADGRQVVGLNEGSAALAKAGTGDVLAGMIGALLAQRMNAMDACYLGVSLHGIAGRLAAQKLTDICVGPRDVISYLPAAIQCVIQGC